MLSRPSTRRPGWPEGIKTYFGANFLHSEKFGEISVREIDDQSEAHIDSRNQIKPTEEWQGIGSLTPLKTFVMSLMLIGILSSENGFRNLKTLTLTPCMAIDCH